MTGSGTLLDPYIIYDVDDLQDMGLDLAAYYELANDIDAIATVGWNAGAGFVPIGTFLNEFTGHLDGKDHKVTDLVINRAASDYQALIGRAEPADGYIVKNLTMEGGSVTGDDYCGALVGYVRATGAGCVIENCHSDLAITGDLSVGGLAGRIVTFGGHGITVKDCDCTGNVVSNLAAGAGFIGGLIGRADGSVIDTCYATGSVTAAGAVDNIGGLVGFTDGSSFRDSCATGVVTGGDDYCGGFIGRADDVQELQRCRATGNISTSGGGVGGFIGRLDMATGISCRNCYARGNATGGDSDVGGFVGYFASGGIIDDCYSTGDPTGPAAVGGFCGLNLGTITASCFWDTDTSGEAASDGGTGKTTAEMKTWSTFASAGWSSSVWGIIPVCNDGYPCLRGVDACCPKVRVGGGHSGVIDLLI